MGRLKFEKLNMKMIITIAVVIVVLLTLVVVVMNVDFGGKKEKEKPSNSSSTSGNNGPIVSEEARQRLKDVNELTAAEKKYIIEENFNEYFDNLDPDLLQEYLDSLGEECASGGRCEVSIEDFLNYISDPNGEEGSEYIKIKDCQGRIYFVYKDKKVSVDMSAVSCNRTQNTNSNSGNNTNPNGSNSNKNSNKNPGGSASGEAVGRTKPSSSLTTEEKKYLVYENMITDTNGASGDVLKENKKYCITTKLCDVDAKQFGVYATSDEIGTWMEGCTGKAYLIYVPGYKVVDKKTEKALKVVKNDIKDKDFDEEKQIRLRDIPFRLSDDTVKEGNYVVKTTVEVYVGGTKTDKGALKVVKDDVSKVGKDEIKISDVAPRSNLAELKAGDYVVKMTLEGYKKSSSNVAGALKIIANNKQIKEGEINLVNAKPLIDKTEIKEGDYVLLKTGGFILDMEEVTCKRG